MATVDITIQTAVNIHDTTSAPRARPDHTAPASDPDRQDAATTTAGDTPTAWELKVDTVSHTFKNLAIPLPLPTAGARLDQLQNMVVDLGMRSEIIKLNGILVDRGTPSASNPRKQTLLDIARTQFSSTIDPEDTRGASATTDNQNAYLILTLGSGTEPSDDASGFTAPTQLIVQDTNTVVAGYRDTTAKIYRGLISDLSFTQRGGRPDIWTWTMTFYVVKNEHDH